MHQIFFYNYFTKQMDFVNFSITSNIFRDFYNIKSMNKVIIIGIPVFIAIIIGILSVAMISEDPDTRRQSDNTRKN